MNSVFCANHVITVQTSSPSSLTVTTSIETKTSTNEQTTSISKYITRYTKEQATVTEHESASETAFTLGKY